MTWRENISPTTTILLTLITLLNILLYLASVQNNGMIRLREMQERYFTVTRLNTQLYVNITRPYVAEVQEPSPEPKQLDQTSQQLANVLEMGSEENRTVVLLVSDYRSGSSLLGEMFNQNDDVFYLFEPLLGVIGPSAQKRFLERLLSCNPLHWGFL